MFQVSQQNRQFKYKSTYRPEIDGLRAFAVLSVVAFHAFPSWLNGGFIGVDVFFVISGFLISTYIFENLDKGQFSFVDFYSRRIRRIFPALILVMICSVVFGWFVLLSDEFVQLTKHIWSSVLFIVNFVLVNENGYFDNASETKPMLHLWSLAVEEQFYIIWPFILWLFWRLRLNLLTITVIILVVSFYLNIRFVKIYPIEMFFLSAGRFWELLSGSILAWLFLFKVDLTDKLKICIDKYLVKLIYSKDIDADGITFSNIISCFGFVCLAYSVVFFNKDIPFPSAWTLIPVLGTLFIIAGGSKAWLNRLFLMNPVAVWFGLISYPLYLWHWPILSFLQIINEETPQRDGRIIAVCVSIILAWVTYKFIENPIRFGSFRKKLSSLFIAFILFFVGGVSYYASKLDWSDTHGFEDIAFPRKGFEHGFGSSLDWYKGKNDWLFLGNNPGNDTVAKLKLVYRPTDEEISNLVAQFSALVIKGAETKTKVALLVGPNKSSIYPEYLPSQLVPSNQRYVALLTEPLKTINNLTVTDPTIRFIESKSNEGLLYWRTDSHWNQKGAFIAFKSLLEDLDLKYPDVKFTLDGKKRGDLLNMSNHKNKDLPITVGDNWKYDILTESLIVREEHKDHPMGWQATVTNSKALNDMSVWVIADSFATAISPYLEATFKEVNYLGHYFDKFYDNKILPTELSKSTKKPDLVLILKVERQF